MAGALANGTAEGGGSLKGSQHGISNGGSELNHDSENIWHSGQEDKKNRWYFGQWNY